MLLVLRDGGQAWGAGFPTSLTGEEGVKGDRVAGLAQGESAGGGAEGGDVEQQGKGAKRAPGWQRKGQGAGRGFVVLCRGKGAGFIFAW